jgi:AcrR family transcriptional regulator
MARPARIDTRELLDTARSLFLEHGFGVSTSAIARQAGISEGSIFKRFPSKEALFCAALAPPVPEWTTRLDEEGPPREVLIATAREALAFYREMVPRMSMLRSSLPCQDVYLDEGSLPGPVRAVRATSLWFERHRDGGRLDLASPETAARMFVGALVHYAFFEHMGFSDAATTPSPEAYAESVVDTLLRGVAPRPTSDDAPEDPR